MANIKPLSVYIEELEKDIQTFEGKCFRGKTLESLDYWLKQENIFEDGLKGFIAWEKTDFLDKFPDWDGKFITGVEYLDLQVCFREQYPEIWEEKTNRGKNND